MDDDRVAGVFHSTHNAERQRTDRRDAQAGFVGISKHRDVARGYIGSGQIHLVVARGVEVRDGKSLELSGCVGADIAFDAAIGVDRDDWE